MKAKLLLFAIILTPGQLFAGLLDTHQMRQNGKDQYMIFNYAGLHLYDGFYEVSNADKIKATEKIDGILGQWKGYGAKYNLGTEINRAFQFNAGAIVNSATSVDGYYLDKNEFKGYVSMNLVLTTPAFNVVAGGGLYSSLTNISGPDFSQKLDGTGTMYNVKIERMLSQYYSVSFYYMGNNGLLTPQKEWKVKGTETELGKFSIKESSKEIGLSLTSWFY